MKPGDHPETRSDSAPPLATSILLSLAFLNLLIHVAASHQYGFFRDELYYIEWSKRLAWGYVEQPPLTAAIVWLSRMVLGESLMALRFFPALLGAVIVFVTGLIAREMGGRRFAQGFAAFCVLMGPIFLGTCSLMTMNVLEMVCWVVCLWLLARLFRTGNRRLWIGFGLVSGIGLMAKLSVLFFGVGVVAALMFTPHRKDFLRKEIWIGGALAAALFAPFVAWLAAHDWATIEFMVIYGSGGKTYQAGILEWLFMQIMAAGLLSLPVWALGLHFCLLSDKGRPFRFFGWLFLILFLMFYLLRAKYYFLSPVFPALLAAGAVAIELRVSDRRFRCLKPICVTAVGLFGLLSAPMAIHVLPVDALLRCVDAVRLVLPKGEQLEERELPQHLADQFGWEEMVKQIDAIYRSLPPEDQEVCGIFASNYGEAGAVDFYGPATGLPKAISGHNSYHLWGPGDVTGEVMIVVTAPSEKERLEQTFERVEVRGTNDCGLCMPYERNRQFFLCRGIRMPIAEIWPAVKHYD